MKKLLTILLVICITFSLCIAGCDFSGNVNLGGGNDQNNDQNDNDSGLGGNDDNTDQDGDNTDGDNANDNGDNDNTDNGNDNSSEDDSADEPNGEDDNIPATVTLDGVIYQLVGKSYVVADVELESGQKEVTVLGELNGKKVTKIEPEAFMGKKTITKVTLPESVKEIGASGFRMCRALLEINLENIETIGEYAFYDCAVLPKADLSSLDSMGQRAFEKCVKLKTVTFGGDIWQIPVGAFSGCTILKTVVLTEQIFDVGEKAFNGCGVLSVIDLSHVEHIGKGAFAGCIKLIDIRLDSVKTIQVEAFSGCSGLKTVYIGAPCELFYRMSFASCSSITGITIEDKVGWRTFFTNSRNGTDMYEYAPSGYYTYQIFQTPEGAKNEIVPDAWGSGNNFFYAKYNWLVENLPQFAK